MATNVTADHTEVFDAIFDLTGETIDIDGSSVSAILPYELAITLEIDGPGATQYEGESRITVKTSELPAVNRDSIATIGGTEYRITAVEDAGVIAKTLTIINP